MTNLLTKETDSPRYSLQKKPIYQQSHSDEVLAN